MKSATTLILFILSCLQLFADEPFAEYKKRYEDWYKVSIKYPSSKVTYSGPVTPYYYLNFAKSNKYGPGGPIFIGGPIVTLSKDCKILLYDILTEIRPDERHPDINLENFTSAFESMMLFNCNRPWSKLFFLEHTGIAVSQKEKDLSWPKKRKVEFDKEKESKTNAQYTKKYVKKQINNKLTALSNSELIYIVTIPKPELINCFDGNWLKQLNPSDSKCYGVEFFNTKYNCTLQMLVFIKKDSSKDILSYVNDISQNIKFGL